MLYAIIYQGEPKEINTPDGKKILQSGILLGYTEFPEDECWQDKTEIQFVEVETIEKEPHKWKYENGQWLKVEET